MKKFLSVFLALAVIAAQLAFICSAMPSVKAANINFKCGDNATWYLDEYGVLTISGTGDMYSFNDEVINEEPWYDFRYSIKSVVIEEGITNIGCGAFSSCYNATSLHIASTVERIEYGSLGSSSKKTFEKITVGENSMLRQIDDYALSDTRWYENYPDDSPIYIGRLLYGFKGFPESDCILDIKDGTYAINTKALFSRSQIAQVNIPDSVEHVGSYAFLDTSWVNNHPAGPIYSGSVLVGYSGGVPLSEADFTVKEGTKCIASHAFYNCDRIMNLTLPSSLKTIGAFAFAKCINLETVNFSSDSAPKFIGASAFNGCESLPSFVLPESVEEIGNYAFSSTKIKELCLSENVKKVGIRFIKGSDVKLTLAENNPYLYMDEYCVIYNKSRSQLLFALMCTVPTEYTVDSGCKFIHAYAFEQTRIQKINLNEGLEYIDDYAFQNSNLTSVTLPDSFKRLGLSVFSGCPITEIDFGAGITVIPSFSFSGISTLKEVVFPSNITELATTSFRGCSNLEKAVIPATVTRCSAFEYCDALTIYCYSDSAAHTYAVSEKIPYVLLDGMVETSEITDIISKADGIDRSLYTAESLAELDNALNAVDLDKNGLTQDEINDWTLAIRTAIENLDYAPADFSQTDILISQANGIDRSLYTAESLADLDEAVEAVDKTVTKENQSKVAQWNTDIQNAIENLKYAPADFSQTDILISQANGIDRSLYTAESLADLDEAVAAVDKTVTKENQSKVTQWNTAIENAIENLKYAPADFSQTDALIKQASGIDRSLYTAESLAELDKAVEAVDKSVTKENQSQVFVWNVNIEKAIENLKYAPADFSQTDALIRQASGIDRSLYTADSLASLDKAIAAVDKSVTKENQAKVSAWNSDIEKAIKNLKYAPADFSVVDALISKANKIDRSLYTAESLAELDKAVAAVDKTVTKENQAKVAGWVVAIDKAMNNLEYAPADFTAVDAAIKKAQGINRSFYTAESLAALDKAVAAVDKTVTKEKQSQVNSWASSINTAINNLKYKPADYTQVNKAVAAANKIDLRLYSDYTVTVLKNALNSVNYNLKINEQKKVDGYAASINTAIAGLQYATVTLRHNACGVIVTATAKEIDPDTSLTVEMVDSSTHEGSNFAVGGSIKSLYFYDINLVLSEKTVQPNGTVTVKIKLASGVDPKKCKVYHVTDDKVNPLVRFSSTIDGNYIVFETTHFSEFAVIEVETVVDSVEILSLPSKTEYYTGETLDTAGMTVVAHYSDGTSKAVTDFNIGMVDLSTPGAKKVTVYYTYGNVTKNAVFEIKVNLKTDGGKPVNPPEEKPSSAVSAEITADGKPAESYAKKLSLFSLYSRASISLGCNLENADGCTLRWSSDSSKVFVDGDGRITCKGLFGAKKAKITLEVIDSEGNVAATDTIQIIFYKLSFQLSGFATQVARIIKQSII